MRSYSSLKRIGYSFAHFCTEFGGFEMRVKNSPSPPIFEVLKIEV